MNCALVYPDSDTIKDFYDNNCKERCKIFTGYCYFMKKRMVKNANKDTSYVKTTLDFLEYEDEYFKDSPYMFRICINKIYPRIDRIKGLNRIIHEKE